MSFFYRYSIPNGIFQQPSVPLGDALSLPKGWQQMK